MTMSLILKEHKHEGCAPFLAFRLSLLAAAPRLLYHKVARGRGSKGGDAISPEFIALQSEW